MNCRDVQDVMGLYCLGDLEVAERQQVREHLASGCVECVAALAQTDAVLGQLPELLKPVEPDRSAKQRLMSRFRESRKEDPDETGDNATVTLRRRSVATPRVARHQDRLRTIAWSGVSGAIVASIVFYLLITRPMYVDLDEVQRSRIAQSVRIDQLSHQLELAQESFVLIQSPDHPAIPLQGTDSVGNVAGHALWDKKQQQMHCYLFEMQPASAGKSYELKAMTPLGEIQLGQLRTDANGIGVLLASIPKDTTDVSAVIVSLPTESD